MSEGQRYAARVRWSGNVANSLGTEVVVEPTIELESAQTP